MELIETPITAEKMKKPSETAAAEPRRISAPHPKSRKASGANITTHFSGVRYSVSPRPVRYVPGRRGTQPGISVTARPEIAHAAAAVITMPIDMVP